MGGSMGHRNLLATSFDGYSVQSKETTEADSLVNVIFQGFLVEVDWLGRGDF